MANTIRDKNKVREIVQSKALSIWEKKGKKGTLAMATGTGKSKIPIDYIKEHNPGRVLLVVPTTKLRDENWENEFSKWKAKRQYKKIDRYCYASINKLSGQEYDLVVMDEIHNITELNSQFFDNNKVKEIIGLTATPPRDVEKQQLLTKHCPVVLKYTLDQAVKDGIVAPYSIKIIETYLDDADKYVQAGTKARPFKSTEQKQYDYLSNQIKRLYYQTPSAALESRKKFLYLQRARLIYNLKSKEEIASFVIKHLLNDKKCLIFCGSIAQAERLCDNVYHSKSGDKDLEKFQKGEINLLACVNKLNEGMNIPDLDMALIVQANSNEKDLIQRIGRVVRLRKGHRAEIIILACLNTQDEKWVAKALEGFNDGEIEYISAKNIFRTYS